jgi:hypothetical protein
MNSVELELIFSMLHVYIMFASDAVSIPCVIVPLWIGVDRVYTSINMSMNVDDMNGFVIE